MRRWPHLPEGAFIRTCQECESSQVSKRIPPYQNDKWRDVKCRACKSIALDYGAFNIEFEEEKD